MLMVGKYRCDDLFEAKIFEDLTGDKLDLALDLRTLTKIEFRSAGDLMFKYHTSSLFSADLKYSSLKTRLAVPS